VVAVTYAKELLLVIIIDQINSTLAIRDILADSGK
jgi:hypothetical protein